MYIITLTRAVESVTSSYWSDHFSEADLVEVTAGDKVRDKNTTIWTGTVRTMNSSFLCVDGDKVSDFLWKAMFSGSWLSTELSHSLTFTT